MAEEWLKRLAEQIKEKDRGAAEESARANLELAIIKTDGPVLWRSFADLLKKCIADMVHELEGDVTLREGPLSFGFDPRGGLKIEKVAFPAVWFSAVPQYDQRSVQITYLVVNPQRDPNQAYTNNTMPCRFEVGPEDTAFLQLDGKPFREAHEAARYIMEKLFAVA